MTKKKKGGRKGKQKRRELRRGEKEEKRREKKRGGRIFIYAIQGIKCSKKQYEWSEYVFNLRKKQIYQYNGLNRKRNTKK